MTLQDELAQARAEVAVAQKVVALARGKLSALRKLCPHIQREKHSDYTGDTWETCVDCGGSSERGWN